MPALHRDGRGTRYAINEEEANDVRRIFDEYLAGGSMGQIARDLNDSGRLTRKGTRWHAATIRRLLMNPLYAALLPPAQPTGKHSLAAVKLEECVPGAWEPIVSRDLIMATRGRLVGVKPNHEGTARKWLLSGLTVCAVCRGAVRSARGETHPTARVDGSGKAKAKRYHAYRCVNGHLMRNGDVIDEFISEVCIARLSEPDVLDLFKPEDEGPSIGILHAQREELESREAAIAMLVANGSLKPQAAEEALADLAAKTRDVDVQIANAVRRDPLAELANVEDVRAWWEDATLARRRAIIDALMTVAIQRVGPGKRITSLEACAKTVTVEWKR